MTWRDPPTECLLAELGDARSDTRLAAARALGRIDGPELTVRLADLVRRDVNRREALAALMLSAGPEAQQFLEAASRQKSIASVIHSVKLTLSNRRID